jgi:hypothetical protein
MAKKITPLALFNSIENINNENNYSYLRVKYDEP